MHHCSRFLIICCILFFPSSLFAQQDLTGLWKGYMYNDTTQKNYKYEIGISEGKKGKLNGFSHTYFILDDKEYHVVKRIKLKKQGDKILVEDVEMIANNYPADRPKGVHQSNVLEFEIKDNVMILAGPFKTNPTKIYRPVTGYIHVERKSDFRQSALIPHLEELGLAKELSFVQEENIVKTKPEVKPAPVTEQPVVKTTPPVKEKTITEQPVVKTTPVTTEKTITEQPVAKTTTPVTKPEIKPVPVQEKPVVKTTSVASIKEKQVAEKSIVKTTPVTTEKPVAEKIVKAPETAVTTATGATASAIDADRRSVETIQALYFKTDSLVLTLYDNGEVDGDTVSVLMNGKLIMPSVGLSTNAVRKTIYIQDNQDSIQLVMYAETLGSLPPNTGLLIVYDGSDRYEIRFRGDMEKSSAIVFRRRK